MKKFLSIGAFAGLLALSSIPASAADWHFCVGVPLPPVPVPYVRIVAPPVPVYYGWRGYGWRMRGPGYRAWRRAERHYDRRWDRDHGGYGGRGCWGDRDDY